MADVIMYLAGKIFDGNLISFLVVLSKSTWITKDARILTDPVQSSFFPSSPLAGVEGY